MYLGVGACVMWRERTKEIGGRLVLSSGGGGGGGGGGGVLRVLSIATRCDFQDSKTIIILSQKLPKKFQPYGVRS